MSKCGLCHEELEGAGYQCTFCSMKQHLDCAEYAKGCVQFLCKGTPPQGATSEDLEGIVEEIFIGEGTEPTLYIGDDEEHHPKRVWGREPKHTSPWLVLISAGMVLALAYSIFSSVNHSPQYQRPQIQRSY